MSAEIYPCYIRIGDEKDAEEMLELPTESDGTICLTTIQSQYPDTIGLRFKSASGSWRGVKLSDNIFSPPLEGWGQEDYFVTYPKAGVKRKGDDDNADAKEAKTKKITDADMLQDLIVLGLPYTATDEDVKTYFEKFGELDMYQIKTEPGSNKSRGFGFVRFKSVEVVEAVLAASHTIHGRKCQVRFPSSKTGGQLGDIPTKLFVGRLADGTTMDDLREHFSPYGVLTDVYIPAQFRGFGFITFASPVVAQAVLNKQHQIKGNYVNLSIPTPKGGGANQMQQQQFMGMPPQQQYGGGYGNMQGNMQRNMGGPQQGGQGYGGPQGGPQGARGYGFGNQGNNPQGFSSYFQQGGKFQNGKMI